MIRRSMALGMCLMAVGAAPALAQDPTTAGYGETPVPPVVTPPTTPPVDPPVVPPVVDPCAAAANGSAGPSSAACAPKVVTESPKKASSTPAPPKGGVAPARVQGTTCAGDGSGSGGSAGGSACDKDSSVAGARTAGGSDPAASAGEDTAPVTPVAATGDSLPFTGLDIGVIALMAFVLLAAGFGLRRATNNQH